MSRVPSKPAGRWLKRDFIRRPVVALVVNLLIVIAGVQAIRSLNVRQYPRSENAAIRR